MNNSTGNQESKNKRLLEIFFDNISDNLMPSFILSAHDNTDDIKAIKDKLKEIKSQYITYDVDIAAPDFSSKFRKDMVNFISFTDVLTQKNTDLTPIHQLAKSINSEITSLVLLALKDINKELNSEIDRIKQSIKKSDLILNPSPVKYREKFIELFDNLRDYFKPVEVEKELSEETWKSVAIESLKKLRQDFNFKAISIEGSSSWRDVCEWASDTYRVIKECQQNIGIEHQNTGINATLSLAYSPNYLHSISAKAAMFGDASFNTIHLRQTNNLEQKECWQHEYAHVLDNRSGVDYLESLRGHKPLFSEKAYLSTLMISRVQSTDACPDSQLEAAAVWTSEALSAVMGGLDFDSFQHYQENVAQTFFIDIYKCIVQACLVDGEKDWLRLSTKQQEKILNATETSKFCRTLANELFSGGDVKLRKFLTLDNPLLMHDDIVKFFDFIDYNIHPLLDKRNNGARDVFLKNKDNTVDDLKTYIKNNGFIYDNDSQQNFFLKSDTANAALKDALEFQTSYYTKPLEVFARACQGLQTPLMLGSRAFHEINNINKEAIYPVLNKDERTLLVVALHKMAQQLGLNVNSDIEQIPCLHKQLNKNEETKFQHSCLNDFTTHSNATGDEHKAKAIVEIAKFRESKVRSKNTI